MNYNPSVHDLPIFGYCLVIGDLSYIKGKVHEKFMCQMQDRQGKFDGYVSCTFPYLLILAIYRKFLYFSSDRKTYLWNRGQT